jgi:hypothetical protein
VKKIPLILLASFYVLSLYSQEGHYLGIEVGAFGLTANTKNIDNIRNTTSSSYDGSASANLSTDFSMASGGVRYEQFWNHHTIGISSGLKLTYTESRMYNENYFFLLFKQSDQATEYLRVKEYSQASYYVGIPIKVRVFPVPEFPIFGALGADVNILAHSNSGVSFYNSSMSIYKPEVKSLIEKPKTFCSFLYLSGGVMLEHKTGYSLSIEIMLPIVNLTSSSAGLTRPIAGSGIQLGAQFPLKKHEQKETK